MEKNLYENLTKTLSRLQNDAEKIDERNQKEMFEFFRKLFDCTEKEFQAAGFRENLTRGVENILVVRTDAIGDFVLTTGFIRELRKNFPKARITLVVSPLVYPIAELCPYANEVFKFDGKTVGKKISDVFKNIAEFCEKNLWRKHFTKAFSTQWGSDNLGAILMSFLSGAKERIGYGTIPYKTLLPGVEIPDEHPALIFDNEMLTKNPVIPPDWKKEVEKHLGLLLLAGLKLEEVNMELWYDEKDFRSAEKFLSKLPPGKKAVIGLGAGETGRQYPTEKWVPALTEINRRGINFVIVGGEGEKKSANFLYENLPEGIVLNLTGLTTLRETEAVIAQSDFYIGNDTGVMHMSAAAGLPVLAVYREAIDKENDMAGLSSEYLRFPPWQTVNVVLRPTHALGDCANKIAYGGCSHREPHCITQIPPEEIVSAFDALCEYVNSQKSK